MGKWMALVAFLYPAGLIALMFAAEALAPLIASGGRRDWPLGIYMSLFIFFNLAFFAGARLLAAQLRAHGVR